MAMSYQLSPLFFPFFYLSKYFMCNNFWERRRKGKGSAQGDVLKKTSNAETKIRDGAVKGRKRQIGKKRKHLTALALSLHSASGKLYTSARYAPRKQLPPWAVSLACVPPHTRTLSTAWQVCTKPNKQAGRHTQPQKTSTQVCCQVCVCPLMGENTLKKKTHADALIRPSEV